MTQKWLSGVLAFAMIFGATAPMAIAEEAPVTVETAVEEVAPVVEEEQAAVVAEDEIEEVEQNALYNPSVSNKDYVKPAPAATAKTKDYVFTVSDGPAMTDVSLSYVITYGDDKDNVTYAVANTTDDGDTFETGDTNYNTYNLGFKINQDTGKMTVTLTGSDDTTDSDKARAKGTKAGVYKVALTFNTLDGATEHSYVNGKTINFYITVADKEAEKVIDWKQGSTVVDAEGEETTNLSLTPAMAVGDTLYYVVAYGEYIPKNVSLKASTNASQYLSISTVTNVKSDPGNSATNGYAWFSVKATAANYSGDNQLASVKLTVTTTPDDDHAAESKEISFKISASSTGVGDKVYPVSSLAMSLNKSTIDAGGSISALLQAKRYDEYDASKQVDYDDAALDWYINDTKVDFDTNGKGYYKVIVDGKIINAVTIEKKKVVTGNEAAKIYDTAATITGSVPGSYSVRTVAVNGSASTSNTIKVNTVKPEGIYFTDVGAKTLVTPSTKMTETVTNIAIQPGKTFDVSALYTPTMKSVIDKGANGTTPDADDAVAYETAGSTQYITDGVKWSVCSTINGVDLSGTAYEKYISIDQKGVITVSADFPFSTAKTQTLYVRVTSTADASKYVVGKIEIVKEAVEAEHMYVTINGTIYGEISAIDKNNNGVYDQGEIVTSTKNAIVYLDELTSFSALTTDRNKISDGIEQGVVWSIYNAASTTDAIEYASVDANGVVKGLVQSAGKCSLIVTSAANTNLQVEIPLVITKNPAATLVPTEVPATETPIPVATPTTIPSQEPTSEPTTAPTTAPTQAPAYETGTVKVSSTLNVREQPSTSAAKVTTLKNGAKVTVVEKLNGWYGILLSDGSVGYVSSAYVTIDAPEVEASYAVVTTSGSALNMRSAASSSASKVTTIPNGAEVEVVKYGTSWCQVKYNGKTGYCSTAYLTMVEDSVG